MRALQTWPMRRSRLTAGVLASKSLLIPVEGVAGRNWNSYFAEQ
jgi:hypothetical protein